MKKSFFLGMALAIGAAYLAGENQGRAQVPGPAEQPTLRNPFLEPAPQPSGLPFPLNQQDVAGNAGPSATARAANQPDPNLDILVTEKQGPWMISVNWYSGPEAAVMARQMVMELRNHCRLPAYVFNRGAEERRKEDARVKAIVDQQRQFLAEKGLPLNTPLRVKRMQIEEQCAVLVGDYPDDEAARRGLNEVRKLKPPDPNRVKLSTMFYQDYDEKTGKVNKEEIVYVNPFAKAFVVHNPALKIEKNQGMDESERTALQMLNRGEDYSLFNCKKPYTLVIKQFSTPRVVQPRSSSGTFLTALGLGKTGDGIDTAAHNAHNLAELMRKSFQLEAYVLHTRHSSIVTVGGFEGPADPHMRSTQEMLTNNLKVPSALPMAVPR